MRSMSKDRDSWKVEMRPKTEAEMKPSGWAWRVRPLGPLEMCVTIHNTDACFRQGELSGCMF